MQIKLSRKSTTVFSIIMFLIASLLSKWYIGFLIFVAWYFYVNPRRTTKISLKTPFSKFVVLRLIFLIYCLISILWLDLRQVSIDQKMTIIFQMIEIIGVAAWLEHKITDMQSMLIIIKGFCYFGTFLSTVLILFVPISMWTITESNSIISFLAIGRNGLGMIFAWSSFLYIFLFTIEKKSSVYLILAGECLFVCAMTGSRKAIIIAVFCMAFYFILKDRNYKLILNIAIACVVVVIAWNVIMKVPELYQILGRRVYYLYEVYFLNRNVANFSIIERAYYRKTAIELFMHHPVMGIGFDGFREYMAMIKYSHVAYSHCNYTEILANGGILGFLLYYGSTSMLLFRYVEKWIFGNLTQIGVFGMVILMMFLILEYGCVTYYSLEYCFPLLIVFCMEQFSDTRYGMHIDVPTGAANVIM